MLPVLNRSPYTGLPVAALVTHETRPEQSVPRGESPPEMYGVPDTECTSVKSVTVANMRPDANRSCERASKSVTATTIRDWNWLVHGILLCCGIIQHP
jgi:hypothetical protein